MGRIRSVHPSQWTDENFVGMSMAARLLAIAIRNECDDQGVFEWKPLTIKMRLFPADDVDASELLAELAAADQCRQFEVGGKTYGAVRNFRLFQRPKKPNATYPLPDELRIYVGLDEGNGEPVPNQLPTASEKPPQMEDGGGSGEKEPPNGGSKKRASRIPPDWQLTEHLRQWATSAGLTGAEAKFEAEQFKDYWDSASGQSATKLDWDKAFQVWARKRLDDPRRRRDRQRQEGDRMEYDDAFGGGPLVR